MPAAALLKALMAINRLSADPHEGVTTSGSGVVLLPLAPVEISGGVVPCHDEAEMRTAMAANRSETSFVTVTLVSPPLAIRWPTPMLQTELEHCASLISTHGLGKVRDTGVTAEL